MEKDLGGPVGQQIVHEPELCPVRPGKPVGSWHALEGMLPAGHGGDLVTQPWWGTSGVLCPILGSKEQERHDAP